MPFSSPRTPKSILIIGASSGIGRTTALHLAQRGHTVAATGRSLERLGEVEAEAHQRSICLSIYQLDVNDTSSVSQQVPVILEDLGGLDMLVNNAGYGLWGCVEELGIDELRDQFETNLFAVARMCQAVLPHMRARGHGTIINVGSIAAHIGSPGGGGYAASKAALRSLSKVLRMEVQRFGVRVTMVEPGLFRSKFVENQTIARRASDADSPYQSYAERVRGRSSRFHLRGGDPLRVARLIEKIMLSRRVQPRYSVGLEAGLGVMATRILPEGILEFLVKRVLNA